MADGAFIVVRQRNVHETELCVFNGKDPVIVPISKATLMNLIEQCIDGVRRADTAERQRNV